MANSSFLNIYVGVQKGCFQTNDKKTIYLSPLLMWKDPHTLNLFVDLQARHLPFLAGMLLSKS